MTPTARVLGVLAVVTIGLGTACTSSGATAAAPDPTATTPAAHGCLPAGETASSTAGPYDVGRLETTFVDSTRPTAARPARQLDAHPDRTLPTVILYPTSGGAPADGQFPLVVVSHGVTSTGPTMAGLVQNWVEAGYIVAAPTFPLGSGPGADITDMAQQATDIGFVADSVRSLAGDPTRPLSGHLAPDCLALAGHSMGAANTFEAGFESGYAEPGLDAVIEMSGVMVAMPPGSFDDPPAIPLLLLHGDHDPVVSITGSANAFATLPGPNYFVTFLGADHNSIFKPPAKDVLDAAAIAFLDAELKGGEPAAEHLHAIADGSDLVTLQVKEG